MIAKQITDTIDARLAELRPWIAAQQEAYLATNGRYASLGWSHSQDPADGAVKQPDRLRRKLSHQAETWTNFGYPIQEPVANAAIDEYLMPNGRRGWVLRLSLVVDDKTWRKAIDSGEGGFGREWELRLASVEI